MKTLEVTKPKCRKVPQHTYPSDIQPIDPKLGVFNMSHVTLAQFAQELRYCLHKYSYQNQILNKYIDLCKCRQCPSLVLKPRPAFRRLQYERAERAWYNLSRE